MNTLKHTWMTAAYLCAAIIGFATASASSKDTAAPAEHKPEENKPVEHQVDIKNFLYNPDPIRVKPGDTITWTNHDIVPHTATITETDLGTGEILLSDSGSILVQERGSLAYHCRYHANMHGVIEVE